MNDYLRNSMQGNKRRQSSLVSSLRFFSVASSVVPILVGFVVLVGWTLDIPLLKSILPGWGAVKPNAAFAFILS